MITGELKSRIDQLWTAFWTGGITNPLTVIEQISFLMFARLLDISESRNEKRAARTGKEFRRIFSNGQQHLRWSRIRQLGGEEMLRALRDEVFPHFNTIVEMETPGGKQATTFREYFRDAQLFIQKPSLLVQAVNMIDALPLTEGDTKGDLYEYLLSKLTTAGINGQFRTPRHIIRLMVEMVDPKPTEIIADPACGTGGFLVGTMDYLLRTHTSAGMVEERQVNGHTEKIYAGDLLEPHWDHIRRDMFHGFDFDATMLRIAAMNLLLHGVDNPDIHYQDTLSGSFTDRFPAMAESAFEIVLANPPFKGSLDEEDIHPSLLRMVKTKKTELLFIALILRLLKPGGRCAMIVPDGVLFGSNKAHQAIRQQLVDQNQLEAVVSLPSGVFRPYAGVSTAILVFTKGGRTDQVFFYDVKDDGFSLDDRRTRLYDSDFAGDMPDALQRWRRRDRTKDLDRGDVAFLVPAQDIRIVGYDLSVNKFKETIYKEEQFEDPQIILARMKSLESELLGDITSLATMLK
jgi:type I restriction enzyme M protein